ncbi:type II secretion system F family protein [Halopelagius longus]|uniref:Flagellar protein FlaJ n=1 Tax=Halopelagius longus TaxID=1236180 RepID=A0A1H1BWF4_9EURY|nr:type II secretion system F family protein [Halopelagius longus]RDI70955.1 secretion system protein [Halopelagius longus]SDQ56272.1 flagellar protein FlaJ [Halopelagius longus]
MLVGYLPLLAATLVCVPFACVPFSARAHLLVSRVSLPLFGRYVANENPHRRDQLTRLRAAFSGETHRVYASQTLLMAGAFGVAGSVFGVYLAAGVLRLLAVSEESLRARLPEAVEFLAAVVRVPNLTPGELFVLLLVSSATLGATLAAGTYWARWQYLDSMARARGVKVDATLPRTVAFVYALSRSGMPFPKVLDTLTRNRDVYGEAARELGIAVRDVNAFGTDVITALQRTAERTPSDNAEEFAENLASVLGSGRNLASFLSEQYERFQDEAEAQQKQYLELLSAFAEIYVTVLVAGPLFFITVLVVVGLVMQDTLGLLAVVGYVGVPLATFGFAVYIDSMTESIRTPGRGDGADSFETGVEVTARTGGAPRPESPATVSDGGFEAADSPNRERLAVYDRLKGVRTAFERPGRTFLERPANTLFVTLPAAFVWFALSVGRSAEVSAALETVTAGPVPGASSDAVMTLVAAVDGPLVVAAVLVLGGVALSHEVEKRRLRRIEDEIPDFLDRMASVNEAGATVVGSIERLARTDLGPLSAELERTWRDIRWGADVQTALRRMEERVRTPLVSRAVTLITNAMVASGDIAPVLRIAADEAQDSRRLREERRQEMLTYLVVIYISFLVFLGIIAALTVAFIPAVEAAGSSPAIGSGEVGGVSTGLFSGLRTVDTAAYELLFFHVAAIQGVCSGLVAGQLGEGSLYDGVKHATVLLAAAYLLFAFL